MPLRTQRPLLGRPRLAVGQISLAGLALLAGAVALAVTSQTRHHKHRGPEPVGSFTALAGSSGPAAFGRKTACGGVVTPSTEGVAHPTLPCGARIFITFHHHTVLVQVIDRGPYQQGRQFDLTDALARRLGLSGVQEIGWSYARGG
jgi:rare lipoprotein A